MSGRHALCRLDASSLDLTRPAPGQGRDDALLAPGARLDDYEIVAPLGSGGMGQVFGSRALRLDFELHRGALVATS